MIAEPIPQLSLQAGGGARKRLGELLIEQGALTRAQLDQALTQQQASGARLGDLLLQLGFIEQKDYLRALAAQLELPFVDLASQEVEPTLARCLPEALARRYQAIPVAEHGSALLVAMVDPVNVYAQDQIRQAVGQAIQPAVVATAELNRVLDQLYRRSDEIRQLARQLQDEIERNAYRADWEQALADDELAAAPVVRLFKSIVLDATQIGASDIHLEPQASGFSIRLRVDGQLQEQQLPVPAIMPALLLRLKVLAGLDIAEKRLPQDGRFSIAPSANLSVEIRLSTLPGQHGESAVLRLLNQAEQAMQLSQLGLPPVMQKQLQQLLHARHGMVLVVGPTGSGKTTTLYAALAELNNASRKIITVEDPIECRLPRITQVQTQADIELDFAKVLRSALRHDPDVLMVGEIRDSETASIALRAALTGHLLLSTLHTHDALSTVTRLLDMGLEPYLLAGALRAVVAQRLLRRVCEHCQQRYEPSQAEQQWLSALASEPVSVEHYQQGQGCSQCGGSGYRGRVGIYECLQMNAPLAEALRQNDWAVFARHAEAQKTFVPLLQAALLSAQAGVSSLQEVLELASSLGHGPR